MELNGLQRTGFSGTIHQPHGLWALCGPAVWILKNLEVQVYQMKNNADWTLLFKNPTFPHMELRLRPTSSSFMRRGNYSSIWRTIYSKNELKSLNQFINQFKSSKIHHRHHLHLHRLTPVFLLALLRLPGVSSPSWVLTVALTITAPAGAHATDLLPFCPGILGQKSKLLNLHSASLLQHTSTTFL